DLYDLPPEEWGTVKQVPGSLDAVLNSLEADHEFLTAGDVFTADLIETWIHWKGANESAPGRRRPRTPGAVFTAALIETWMDGKRANETDPVRLRPTPHEFEMYYNV